MTDTVNFALPLLQPSQAQKHVTVNEALTRLDALAALILMSRSQSTPPAVLEEGTAFGVPATATDAWQGHGGSLAIAANGGWVFITPRRGWRAWIADEDVMAIHDGSNWRGGALALSPNGAGSFHRIREFDHVIEAGETSLTNVPVPAHAMVLAVTARVITPISGSLTSWRLGSPGADDRFGAGLGVAAGSYARGLLSTPMSWYAAEPLLLTAAGGTFSGGVVRIAIHHFEAGLPGL